MPNQRNGPGAKKKIQGLSALQCPEGFKNPKNEGRSGDVYDNKGYGAKMSEIWSDIWSEIRRYLRILVLNRRVNAFPMMIATPADGSSGRLFAVWTATWHPPTPPQMGAGRWYRSRASNADLANCEF